VDRDKQAAADHAKARYRWDLWCAANSGGENGQSHREGVTQITQEKYKADLSMLGVLIKSLLTLPNYEARVQHSVTKSKPMSRKLTLF